MVSGTCVCLFFKQKTAYVMRISDGSSDVCSSDLGGIVARNGFDENAGRDLPRQDPLILAPAAHALLAAIAEHGIPVDRKSVVEGKSVSVRVDIGGRSIIKKKRQRRHCE